MFATFHCIAKRASTIRRIHPAGTALLARPGCPILQAAEASPFSPSRTAMGTVRLGSRKQASGSSGIRSLAEAPRVSAASRPERRSRGAAPPAIAGGSVRLIQPRQRRHDGFGLLDDDHVPGGGNRDELGAGDSAAKCFAVRPAKNTYPRACVMDRWPSMASPQRFSATARLSSEASGPAMSRGGEKTVKREPATSSRAQICLVSRVGSRYV
jgi:hypothetical protein